MIAENDVIRVTDKQTWQLEDIINVFYFVVEVFTTGATLLDLLNEFKDEVISTYRFLQMDTLEHTTLVGENLTNGIDTDTLIVDLGGMDTTETQATPTYVAAGFRLNVSDKTTRSGAKRIAGLGETRVSGNIYVPAGETAIDAAAKFEATLEVVGLVEGGFEAVPVVVGRDLLGDLDLNRIGPISSAEVLSTVRSQVSRRQAIL